jgi:hypothetical protein
MAASDDLRPRPVVQLGEIEVPTLPIRPDWMGGERAFAGFTKYRLRMHVEKTRSGLLTHGRLSN